MPTKIDERGFILNNKHFFPIGFNYWPRDAAVYLWEEYDSTAIEKEMRVMSELGANCIRMFIRWEDLNPKIGQINKELLLKLDDFIKLAGSYNINLVPTLLIGHMSGQNWFPEWFIQPKNAKDEGATYQIIPKPPYQKQKCHCRDIYLDQEAVSNGKLQIDTILERYLNNDIIISYDLSNENQYWMKPSSFKVGTNYMREMYEFIKDKDPNHPLTYGMGKLDEISGFKSFGKYGFSQYNDYFSVHVYPEWLYPRTKYLLDFYTSYRIGYECLLANICQIPVQLQEFGLSDSFLAGKEKDFKDKQLYGYYNTALWGCLLNRVTAGVLSWDFCDFLPEMKYRNPYDHKNFELNFGAVDKDYKLKASGKAFQKFSRFIKEVDVTDFSLPSTKIAIVLPDNFNSFPEIKNKRSISEENNLNHQKTLFSAYIFCKMNHFNFDYVSLFESTHSLKPYKLVVFPNVYNMSVGSTKYCLSYLNSGKDKILYISSNSFAPKEILGNNKYMVKNQKLKRMICKTTESELTKMFPSKLTFKRIQSYIVPDVNNGDLTYGFQSTDNSNEYILTLRKTGENKVIFLGTSPEINHTRERNSYKQESGTQLYKSLIKLAKIENTFNCDNSLIETGILYNSSKNEALLIAINHENSPQKCVYELKEDWSQIKEFYNLEFEINGICKQLRFDLKPFGSCILLLKK